MYVVVCYCKVEDKEHTKEPELQETIRQPDNKWKYGNLDIRPYLTGTAKIPWDFLYRKRFHIQELFLGAKGKNSGKKLEKHQETDASKNGE